MHRQRERDHLVVGWVLGSQERGSFPDVASDRSGECQSGADKGDPVRFGKVTGDLLRTSQSHGGSRKRFPGAEGWLPGEKQQVWGILSNIQWWKEGGCWCVNWTMRTFQNVCKWEDESQKIRGEIIVGTEQRLHPMIIPTFQASGWSKNLNPFWTGAIRTFAT